MMAAVTAEAAAAAINLSGARDISGAAQQAVAPVLVPLLDDPLAASDAIAALRRYSLVSPPADGSVSVHRLVQAVTLGQMSEDLAEACGRPPLPGRGCLPEDATQPGTWPVYALLLPHARQPSPQTVLA